MSRLSRTWKIIAEAVRGVRRTPRNFRLSELMSVKRQGKVGWGGERLEPSVAMMQRAELIYRLDPLIFSGVNKLARRIASARLLVLGGMDEEREKTEDFINTLHLSTFLHDLTKDALIYGFGVAEIIRDGGRIVSLVQLDPKKLDYLREGGQPVIEDGRPILYYDKGHGEGEQFSPEELLLIKFYSLGENCLGISPLEPAFKASWIRLNLEEALGEAVFRHGYPLYYFQIGSPEYDVYKRITPELIKEAKEYLKDLDTATELVLPWWVKPGKLSEGGAADLSRVLRYFATEILSALEVPKVFGLTEGRPSSASEELDFEKTVLVMQRQLIDQVTEQLLEPFYKYEHFETRPTLRFEEYSPELQSARIRRLSVYAKYGLIRRTNTLEDEIRRLEGFSVRKRKETLESSTRCIFGLGKCLVREEEPDIPIDTLSAFCNVCVKRIQSLSTSKNGKEKDGRGRSKSSRRSKSSSN